MVDQTKAVLHEQSWIPVLLGWVVRPIAMTMGRHIFIRRGLQQTEAERAMMLRHEMVHVLQFAELGFWKFNWIYVTDWLRSRWRLRGQEDAGGRAYRDIRLEQEARYQEAGATRADIPWDDLGSLRAEGYWRTFRVDGTVPSWRRLG